VRAQAEQEIIAAELAALRAEQPEAVRSGLEEALLAGVAAHHAGCLPAWKSLVERCFQRGASLRRTPSVSLCTMS
jgi:superfamily II RNA helicase